MFANQIQFIACLGFLFGACQKNQPPGKSTGETLPDKPTAQEATQPVNLVAKGPAPLPASKRSPLGVNLAKVGPDASEWLFIDQFSTASEWIADSDSEGFGYGRILAFDDKGWPTAVADGTQPSVVISSGIDGNYLAGTYTLHWEGSGGYVNVQVDGQNIRCVDGKPIENCAAKHALFDVMPSEAGIRITIVPYPGKPYTLENYVKNIRVIVPGGVCGPNISRPRFESSCRTQRGGSGSCNADEYCFDFDDVAFNRYRHSLKKNAGRKAIFHPEALQRLRNFSTLRAVDTVATAESSIKHWQERPALANYSFAGSGLPYELLFALANEMDAHLWLGLPPEATDAFVMNLSNLAQEVLHPNLNFYLEYGSEFWNPKNKKQQTYMASAARARGLSDDNMVVRVGKFYVQRATEVMEIARESLGSRLLAVVALHPEIFSWLSEFLLPPAQAGVFDALAIAPYITIDSIFNEMTMEGWSVDQLFEEILHGALPEEGAAMHRALHQMTEGKALADELGLALIAYGGGLDLSSEGELYNQSLMELFRNANRDERMEEVMLTYLEFWKNIGGKTFVHATHMEPWREQTRSIWQYANEPHIVSIKSKALEKFINTNPCWWAGCEVRALP